MHLGAGLRVCHEEGATSFQGALPLPGGKLRGARECLFPLNSETDTTHAESHTMPPAMALQEEFGWRTVFGVGGSTMCSQRQQCVEATHTSALAEANPQSSPCLLLRSFVVSQTDSSAIWIRICYPRALNSQLSQDEERFYLIKNFFRQLNCSPDHPTHLQASAHSTGTQRPLGMLL